MLILFARIGVHDDDNKRRVFAVVVVVVVGDVTNYKTATKKTNNILLHESNIPPNVCQFCRGNYHRAPIAQSLSGKSESAWRIYNICHKKKEKKKTR
jgi:hypothetical protein